MRLRCRLRELMDERPVTVHALHDRTGIPRQAIVDMRGNKWKHVSPRTLGGLCGELNVTLDQLFELVPDDIWAPIRLRREVTIHYGSRALRESLDGARAGEDAPLRQFIGVWDQRAINLISEHLRATGPDILVQQVEHVTGVERGFDPAVREEARRLFREGNHVLIGSPIANQFAEEVVCHAYGAKPYAPQMRERFPYGFVWESARSVTSSFGWESVGAEFGIVSTRTGKLVAWRRTVLDGEGRDCALILVHRIWQSPVRRSSGGDEERVIIAILGHSGVGTHAAAELATDAACAARLYPPEPGKPLMRVVSATYTSSPVTPARDNREVTGWALADLQPSEGGGELPPDPAETAPCKPRRAARPARRSRAKPRLRLARG